MPHTLLVAEHGKIRLMFHGSLVKKSSLCVYGFPTVSITEVNEYVGQGHPLHFILVESSTEFMVENKFSHSILSTKDCWLVCSSFFLYFLENKRIHIRIIPACFHCAFSVPHVSLCGACTGAYLCGKWKTKMKINK